MTGDASRLLVDPSESLSDRLEAVLDAHLTPETIHSYAEVALVGLIDIVDEACKEYNLQPTVRQDSLQATEDAATQYFRLPDINKNLDQINHLDGEIKSIDLVIAGARRLGRIILPPDPDTDMPDRGSDNDESWESKKVTPRLKTALFVLSQEFNIDLDDREAIQISQGVLQQGMVRTESYAHVVVPSLEKTLLICDEAGNATFVLNNGPLKDLAESSESIIDLRKAELHQLLLTQPSLGKRIIYSEDYVNDLIDSLSPMGDATAAETERVRPERRTYLYPKADETVASAYELSREFEVSGTTLLAHVEDADLKARLGAVSKFKFGPTITNGYTVEQQQIIREHFAAAGLLIERAPDDVMSLSRYARDLGVDIHTVIDASKRLNESLGELRTYKFHARTAPGMTPEQRAIIYDHLQERGVFAPPPPEGVLSVKGISDARGITRQRITNIVRKHADTIGPVSKYKFRSYFGDGYTPEQQEVIVKIALAE